MKYNGEEAYKYLKIRLKRERYGFNKRNETKIGKALSLIKQEIYEEVLSKIKKEKNK